MDRWVGKNLECKPLNAIESYLPIEDMVFIYSMIAIKNIKSTF
jgi:hypothetical protein